MYAKNFEKIEFGLIKLLQK